MAANKHWRLICYDIRDPRRLREVHRIVIGYGTRVQYSVYRARLDNQQVEALRWQLARVMEQEDSLLIVDLCPTCAGTVISRNHVEGWQDPVATFLVVGGTEPSTEQGSPDDRDDWLRERENHEDGEGDPPA